MDRELVVGMLNYMFKQRLGKSEANLMALTAEFTAMAGVPIYEVYEMAEELIGSRVDLTIGINRTREFYNKPFTLDFRQKAKERKEKENAKSNT